MTSSSSPTPPPPSPSNSASPSSSSAAPTRNEVGGGSTNTMSSTSVAAATKAARRARSLQVLTRMAGGAVVLTIPVCYWWYHARKERIKVDELVRTKIRIPGQETMDEIMIEKHCQPGDVVVFDRRCETCATSPWAALACLVSQHFLCSPSDSKGASFNHMGLIVPGYIRTRHDACDPTNLLLLEATPSEGIVARPLLSRLEHSQARSVWLLQLACPGEQRTTSSNASSAETSQQPLPKSVRRTRQHVERELVKFRNQWTDLSQTQGYAKMHSTLTLGGALAYQVGLLKYNQIYQGPASPAAWLCFMGLQQAAAAQNISDADRQAVRVQDFVNCSCSSSSRRRGRSISADSSEDIIRLRPGWRFLAPIPLRENNAPQS